MQMLKLSCVQELWGKRVFNGPGFMAAPSIFWFVSLKHGRDGSDRVVSLLDEKRVGVLMGALVVGVAFQPISPLWNASRSELEENPGWTSQQPAHQRATPKQPSSNWSMNTCSSSQGTMTQCSWWQLWAWL